MSHAQYGIAAWIKSSCNLTLTITARADVAQRAYLQGSFSRYGPWSLTYLTPAHIILAHYTALTRLLPLHTAKRNPLTDSPFYKYIAHITSLTPSPAYITPFLSGPINQSSWHVGLWNAQETMDLNVRLPSQVLELVTSRKNRRLILRLAARSFLSHGSWFLLQGEARLFIASVWMFSSRNHLFIHKTCFWSDEGHSSCTHPGPHTQRQTLNFKCLESLLDLQCHRPAKIWRTS